MKGVFQNINKHNGTDAIFLCVWNMKCIYFIIKRKGELCGGQTNLRKLYTTVTILVTSDIKPLIAMADKKRQAMDFYLEGTAFF